MMISRARALIILCIFSLQRIAYGDCFDSAAAYQGVNADVLRAIAQKENRGCRAVYGKNSNNTLDVGCMQINTVHLKELSTLGVGSVDLLDKCKNIYVGAWHYKKMVAKYGNTWKAVGAYHSQTPFRRDAYAADVKAIFEQQSGRRPSMIVSGDLTNYFGEAKPAMAER